MRLLSVIAAILIIVLLVVIVLSSLGILCILSASFPTPDILQVLIALIAIIAAGSFFIIETRLKKIEEVEELERDLMNTISTQIDLVTYWLPPRTYTQHIPWEAFKIFNRISILFESGKIYKKFLEFPASLYKVNLVYGINYYCQDSMEEAIKRLEEALNRAKTEREKGEVLWKIGIAYRQVCQFEKSKETFEKLGHITDRGSELWALSLIGKAITLYAEYKNVNDYETLVWGNLHNEQNLLREAFSNIQTLWNNNFRIPQLVSFYGALIKMELGENPVDNGVNIFQYTIEKSLINNEYLYPYQEDYAIFEVDPIFWTV